MLLFWILGLSIIHGQSPVLVDGLSPGMDPSFDEWHTDWIQLGDKFIMPMIDQYVGLELVAFENDQFTLLKDINDGAISGNPQDLTLYKGKVYFSALTLDFTDFASYVDIGVTDGTPEGTVMFYDLDNTTTRPSPFVIAESGKMYFSHSDKVYKTYGSDVKNLGEGFFDTTWLHQSQTYCKYNNEIAFIRANDNDLVDLFAVEADTLKKLGTTTVPADFSIRAFGLSPVKGSLLFAIYDVNNDQEADGFYIYNGDSEIGKLTIDGDDVPPRRLKALDDERVLATVFDKGYYIVNGIEGEEVEVTTPTREYLISVDTLY